MKNIQYLTLSLLLVGFSAQASHNDIFEKKYIDYNCLNTLAVTKNNNELGDGTPVEDQKQAEFEKIFNAWKNFECNGVVSSDVDSKIKSVAFTLGKTAYDVAINNSHNKIKLNTTLKKYNSRYGWWLGSLEKESITVDCKRQESIYEIVKETQTDVQKIKNSQFYISKKDTTEKKECIYELQNGNCRDWLGFVKIPNNKTVKELSDECVTNYNESLIVEAKDKVVDQRFTNYNKRTATALKIGLITTVALGVGAKLYSDYASKK